MLKQIICFSLLLIFVRCANKPAIVTSTSPGWKKISEANVDFKTEYREIEVIGADKFAALKFKAVDAPMKLDTVKIFYENDTIEKISYNAVINSGAESNVIKLKGFDTSLRTLG